MHTFDPSGIAVKNGAFLGLPVTPEEADIVILQVPWDVTTSYRPGTVKGPASVIEASYQLDLYSPYVKDFWKVKLATVPLSQEWFEWSQKLRPVAAEVISLLEEGNAETDHEVAKLLQEVNTQSEKFHQAVFTETNRWLEKGKKVITLGGDHSVTYGPLLAHSKKQNLSVLHIDAHADLRIAYEGFKHSHASIMSHVYQFAGVEKLVQVGIRDVSIAEVTLIKEQSEKITTFFDWDIKAQMYEGAPWAKICSQIISKLGPKVYLSFDIDGLDPLYCPNTGTPVPGGMDLGQMTYLLHQLKASGREVVGADLVEVAPGTDDEWDGNVGARSLFQIVTAMMS